MRSVPRRKPTGGTPMKKLIEQEMSKEMEAQKNPPSIVAKLMGLDALPAHILAPPAKERSATPEPRIHMLHPAFGAIRDGNNNHPEKSARGERRSTPNSTTSTVMPLLHPHPHFQPQFQSSGDHREYRDVYEVPPREIYCMKDESSLPHRRMMSHGGRRADTEERFMGRPSEKRMDLVREKFTEAKRLATNHNLLHSKEFQDAIEVLSSNRDLFLKFLEEPNSLFSEYVQELKRAAPLPSQTRRITVLKPSHTPDAAVIDEKPKSYLPLAHGGDISHERGNPRLNSSCVHPKDKPLPQPTRIVVLKPSPPKPLINGKIPVLPSPPLSPVHPEEESLGELLQAHRSRHNRQALGKEMTTTSHHPQDNNYCYRRDEALLSCVLSNGYTGDESSFNRSDCEYLEDDDDEFDNSSDSDIPSPVTRHSWDCNQQHHHHHNSSRLDNSPCSLSSFSRMSYSPESSVIKEAKKRLSERWVMVTSTELGSNNDQKQVRRSVSTLGEMLAIRGANREAVGVSSRTKSCGREQEMNAASACLSADKNDDMNTEIHNAPTLQRSRSVPASSTSSSSVYENIAGENDVNKSPLKDKAKGGKSSFKVKVSNFFLRNKRSAQDKHPASQSSNGGDSSGRSSPQLSSCNLNEGSGNTPMESPSLTPARSFNQDGQAFGPAAEASLIVKASEKAGSESLAEPSPDSVLEAPFKDDVNYDNGGSCFYLADVGSSRAISRSPPIESIARSLPTCDSTRSEKPIVSNPPPSRHSLTKFLRADSEEQEREQFVRKLLSAAGLSGDDSNQDDETTTCSSSTTTGLARWHSLDSPLNPLLLDQFLERKGEEAQCRVRRSNQRLLFDGVNAALRDISWSHAIKGVLSWSAQWQRGVPGAIVVYGPCDVPSVTKQVLGRLNEWFAWGDGEGGGQEDRGWVPPTTYENDTSQVVDRTAGGVHE